MSVSAEEGRYDASYAMLSSAIYSSMGIYEPGTYIISASSLPDAASNMYDILGFVCDIPFVGDELPGYQYVEWGDWLLAIMPDTRFYVKLTEAETDIVVWEGELTSGSDDLYLGDDHAAYRGEMKPKLIGSSVFVYLAKK